MRQHYRAAMPALALLAVLGTASPICADTPLEESMIELLEFGVPGMVPWLPHGVIDYSGHAVGVGYRYPRASRCWRSRDGAVEIAVECAALKDGAAALKYLRDQVGSGGVVPHTPSGVSIGHSVSAGDGFMGANIAYGRFVITVGTVNRARGTSLRGDTPAPVPEMLESIARAVAYSLLRTGLVKDYSSTLASAPRRRAPVAVTMNGVKWAPTTLLRAAGATVITTDGGLEMRITCARKTAMVRAYRSVVEVGNIDHALGVPVFVGIDGPMVPVSALAKALGVRAVVSGKGLEFR